MNELRHSDEVLTTEDFANPARARQVLAIAIDENKSQFGQEAPRPRRQRSLPRASYFATMNCISFAHGGIRYRPRSSMSPGRQ
jgi:hypothetical protein